MIPKELFELNAVRVRWLCKASSEAAATLCTNVRMDDPTEVHCARLVLHIVTNTPLPRGYARELLDAPQYRKGTDVYLFPLEGHVCTLAMWAAAPEEIAPILARFCNRDNPQLTEAAAIRLAGAPAVLGEDRLRALSVSDNRDERRFAARMLVRRPSPHRVEILSRLLDDVDRCVSLAAERAAAHTRDPQLREMLLAKDLGFSLSFMGDPGARGRAESLVESLDPLDGDEAVACAVALGDRGLLEKLWRHPEWDTRSNAIVVTMSRGQLEPARLAELLACEPADHVAELMLYWAQSYGRLLPLAVDALRRVDPSFPRTDALAAAPPAVLDQVRTWAVSDANRCGAAMRLLPEDVAAALARELVRSPEAGARAVAGQIIAHRELRQCIPLVAELCVDEDENVARTATSAMLRVRVPCGLCGFDTGSLKAGSDFSAGFIARHSLGRLIEIMVSEGTWQCDDESSAACDAE